ncbi:hypothetical protein [Bacillus sp. AK031]
MEKIFKKSHRYHTPIQIIYHSDQGDFTKRTILIKKIGTEHIKAYCFYRRQYRTFKTENILAAIQADQVYPVWSH